MKPSILAEDMPQGFCPTPPDGSDYVIEIDSIQPCWLAQASGGHRRSIYSRNASRWDDIGVVSSVLTEVRESYPQWKYRIGLLPTARVALAA